MALEPDEMGTKCSGETGRSRDGAFNAGKYRGAIGRMEWVCRGGCRRERWKVEESALVNRSHSLDFDGETRERVAFAAGEDGAYTGCGIGARAFSEFRWTFLNVCEVAFS